MKGFWNAYAAFSPKGDCLYVLDRTWGGLRAWNIGANDWTTSGNLPLTQVFDFRLSPDGTELAATDESRIAIWDTQSGQPLMTQPDFKSPYTFSPDSKLLAVATQKGVQVWDLSSAKLIRTFHEKHDALDGVSCVAISPGAEIVAIRCSEGLRLYRMSTGEEHVLLPEFVEFTHMANGGWGTTTHSGETTIGIAFSPDGKLLAAWGHHGLKFFDMTQGSKLKRSVPDTSILCLAFSPDGKTYATGDNAGKLTISDLATGNELRSSTIQP